MIDALWVNADILLMLGGLMFFVPHLTAVILAAVKD